MSNRKGNTHLSAAKLAASTIDKELQGHFNTLLREGSLADRMFLNQVLQQLEDGGDDGDLAIASAFEAILRGRPCEASEVKPGRAIPVVERPSVTISIQ